MTEPWSMDEDDSKIEAGVWVLWNTISDLIFSLTQNKLFLFFFF